jgi:hypothetical protein
MDDPGGIGWTGWVILGAAVGIGIGWERVRGVEDRTTLGFKLVISASWALAVAGEVSSFRGFLVVFLSSVGAYKIASMIAEYLLLRFGVGR